MTRPTFRAGSGGESNELSVAVSEFMANRRSRTETVLAKIGPTFREGYLYTIRRSKRREIESDRMWRHVPVAHPEHREIDFGRPLPQANGEGCLYFKQGAQITAVLADSLADAGADLVLTDGSARTRSRVSSVWVAGMRDEIVERSPILDRPRSALGPGRPITITSPSDWPKASAVAGIYRIYFATESDSPAVYIGRSQNLAARPRYHEKTRGRTWGTAPGDILRIELLSVTPPLGSHVWTISDLDDAEAQHIARARERELRGGPVVLNSTGGRNGPPSKPKTHVLVWHPADISPADEPDSGLG